MDMDILELAIEQSARAIEERANVYEIMARVSDTMKRAGADDDDVSAYLDACMESESYANALTLSRSELRKIAG